MRGGESDDGVAIDDADAEADPMYDQAVALVLKTRRPSISLVQRHLRIGYNRAARLIEQMERAGLVSPMQTNGNRDVLVPAGKGEGDDGAAHAPRAGCSRSAWPRAVRAGPVEVYLEGPRFCPQDRALTRRASPRARRSERANALLPKDFCGPTGASTAATSIAENELDSWRVYVRQWKRVDGRKEYEPRDHSYVVLDPVGNCLAHMPGHETMRRSIARGILIGAVRRALRSRPRRSERPRAPAAVRRDTKPRAREFTQTVADKKRARPQKRPASSCSSVPASSAGPYEKPYKQLLVGDGARLDLRRGPESGDRPAQERRCARRTPAALLSGNQDVERAFELDDAPAADGLDWLVGDAADQETPFRRVRLGFPTRDSPRWNSTMRSASDRRALHGFERIPSSRRRHFPFAPPKGADVDRWTIGRVRDVTHVAAVRASGSPFSAMTLRADRDSR